MDRSKKTRCVAAVVYAVAVAIIFGAPIARMFTSELQSDINSYVVLVPVVCVYLLWIRRSSLPTGWRPAPWSAAGLAVAAMCVWMMAKTSREDELTLFALSFILAIWAGGFLLLGQDWMRSAAFPTFFLLFMVPLPTGLVGALESASKLASSEAASWFFGLTGTPTLRDGNVFQLPGITVEVAQECSGIRSSYVLILTSLVAGNLFLTKTWSRILLVCFVVPLGIIRNGFRVWTIATLCIHLGPQMIHSVIHRKGGPVFFALSLIPLLLFIWFLRSLERRREIVVQTSTPPARPSIPAPAARVSENGSNF